jgi:hypothetical protein
MLLFFVVLALQPLLSRSLSSPSRVIVASWGMSS